MEIKDAVKFIEGKIDASDKRTQEAVDTVKKEFDTQKTAFEKQVADLNTEMAKKDATFKDISEEIKELKAKGGRTKAGEMPGKLITMAGLISNAIEEHKEQFLTVANEEGGTIKPIKLKAVDIQSSSLTSANYISYIDWRPGMEPLGQTRLRDLVRTILTDTDFVQFPVANDPVGAGSFGRQTEQATKPQVDRGYDMKNLTLKPMSGFAIASRQSLRNIVFLQSWLPTSMMEQLMDSEDTDFANVLGAAATGSSSTTYTVAAEKLIAYIRNNIKKKYNPTGIATDPDVWSDILVTKPNDYSIPGVVSIDANGTTRILGRPLYPVNWLTGRRCIVGDWTKAAIVQSEGLTVRQSDSHASIFTSNETAFLLERTEALAVFRPNAFITAVV